MDRSAPERGSKLVKVRHDPFVDQRRVLGIRLDKLDLQQKKGTLFNTPIEVCLFTAGGTANGCIIGGCTVDYTPRREGQRWVVEYEMSFDP